LDTQTSAGEAVAERERISPFLARLGVNEQADERAIKRAYARELKTIDQELDPEAFQDLREARDVCLGWLRYREEQADWEAQQALEEQQTREAKRAVEPEANVGEDQGAPVEVSRAQIEAVLRGSLEMGPAGPAQQVPPAPPSAQLLPGQSPEMLSAAVFAELEEALDRDFPDEEQREERLREIFERCLADDRLVGVDARDIFEWRIAQRLARGWRPGNEVLIELAMHAFGWTEDRRRLLRHGRDGRVLEATMQEFAVFEQQRPAMREHLRALMRALRLHDAPDSSSARDQLDYAETFVARFPHIAGLLTSSDKLEAWRKYVEAQDRARRAREREAEVAVAAAYAAQAKQQKRNEGLIGAALLLGVFALMLYFNGRVVRPEPAPVSSTEQAQERALIRRVTDGAEIESMLGSKASPSICGKVQQLASSYPRGADELGPLKGAELDRLIIDCRDGGLWPKDEGFAALAVRARDRQLGRQTELKTQAGPAPAAPYQSRAEIEATKRLREKQRALNQETGPAAEGGAPR
jgi:hypothetical protein